MVNMTSQKNEIVVYQPNDIMRIEVRFEDETVWLQQPRIAELFACSLEKVRLHLKNIYANGELDKTATSKESLEVRQEGSRRVTRRVVYYNLVILMPSFQLAIASIPSLAFVFANGRRRSSKSGCSRARCRPRNLRLLIEGCWGMTRTLPN